MSLQDPSQAALVENEQFSPPLDVTRLQPLERLLSVGDVADLLGVLERTVYRHVWAGKLPHVKVGRLIRIRPSDVHQYLRTKHG